MQNVQSIKTAIELLNHDDYIQLADWMYEKDMAAWDKQIERDSKAGKLDFFIAEASAEYKTGALKEL